ncbi:MAG: L-2-hydroxyglutarate oxidase [Planctomycetota bacterium]|jgi:L-2-hydroxyglutarate oxidase
MEQSDLCVVGGGIVGLATAVRFQEQFPGRRVVVLEKEASVGQHQTGHNSGVLHTGIYYKPGSLKALNCRTGKLAMEAFCREEQIPYESCGKMIVATAEDQIPALRRIFERGQANEVVCEWIGKERLAELEPHTAGIQAIHVPEAGIVDYSLVCTAMEGRIERNGGEVRTGAKVTALTPVAGERVVVYTGGEVQAKAVVNCAGLYSDRVTELSGIKRPARIVPFRGEYYELKPEAQHLCNSLIYPTPDPNFPFLGVHFTRLVGGGVECGPNAVLALAREGYTWGKLNPAELFDTLSYPAFWKIAARYWRTGAGEILRSLSKAAFVRALQKLVPEVQSEHITKVPAGVRAQALAPDGSLVDDFLIEPAGPVINVINAPSPAATSSLAIGSTVVGHLQPLLKS